ncbi:hypothetical protein D3C81_521350 [compost metagenome]
MKFYVLEIDETYRLNGTRNFVKFNYTPEGKEEAINAYNSHYRGMLNLCSIDVDDNTGKVISQKLVQDENGRKYIKGSPFYNFPHVGHKSKIDGTEIG